MHSVAYDERASVRERIFAVVIDVLLIAPIAIILINAAGFAGILISILFGLLYHVYCWTHFTGQTPGKKIINIRVVKTDGREINLSEAFVRYFACLVSVVMMAFTWRADFQDKVAGTMVIKNY